MSRHRTAARRSKPSLAQRADRHVLYEKSVQNIDLETEFLETTFLQLRHRPMRRLREDFCGTANLCCGWVRRHRDNAAFGIDLDPAVLGWAREHNLSRLNAQQRARVELIECDVMKAACPPVDAAVAMNFSYWIFKDRKRMKRYFARMHAALADDGIFFLDAFGGYEASREMEEATKYRGFTYIWDQASYDPISGDILCHIHFRFPDGSRMRKAFSYDWRLWTLPELREMLEETGFRTTIYWEGTDKDGEGNGIFTPQARGEADAGWIAYLVGEKQP